MRYTNLRLLYLLLYFKIPGSTTALWHRIKRSYISTCFAFPSTGLRIDANCLFRYDVIITVRTYSHFSHNRLMLSDFCDNLIKSKLILMCFVQRFHVLIAIGAL